MAELFKKFIKLQMTMILNSEFWRPKGTTSFLRLLTIHKSTMRMLMEIDRERGSPNRSIKNIMCKEVAERMVSIPMILLWASHLAVLISKEAFLKIIRSINKLTTASKRSLEMKVNRNRKAVCPIFSKSRIKVSFSINYSNKTQVPIVRLLINLKVVELSNKMKLIS
jgi:hypothetical protein